MQTRKMSLVESIVNILIGYLINIGVQILVFKYFNLSVPYKENLYIGFIFTVVSLVRSFTLRRLFNKI